MHPDSFNYNEPKPRVFLVAWVEMGNLCTHVTNKAEATQILNDNGRATIYEVFGEVAIVTPQVVKTMSIV